MADTQTVTIPYESLDPLTIGASDDESKIYRDQLELEIPTGNLVGVVTPNEPAALSNVTEAAREMLENPHSGPRFSELLGPDKIVAIIIDNQFRPTPAAKILPAVLDAIEAAGVTDVRVICANAKVFHMSESEIEQKIGADSLARMERLGIAFYQNEPSDPERYVFIGMSSRGTPVWLHKEVAKCDVSLSIGQTQSNHWGAGGGGKLIMPGVVADETIDFNHSAFTFSPKTHYGAMSGPLRADIDEIATMCGLTATLNSVLDTHGRVCFMNFGRHPDAHIAAIRVFNDSYAFERPAGESADIAICGVFAPTDHLFFHTGWGCMSADMVVKDGGTIIYCSPSPGVQTGLGFFPGLALMDTMKPYMPASLENMEQIHRDNLARKFTQLTFPIWAPIYEVMTRKHLTMVTLEENLEMARDIGIDVTTSVDEAFGQAMARHGADAKVLVLPFARYQFPSDAIRMPMEQEPLADAAD